MQLWKTYYRKSSHIIQKHLLYIHFRLNFKYIKTWLIKNFTCFVFARNNKIYHMSKINKVISVNIWLIFFYTLIGNYYIIKLLS